MPPRDIVVIGASAGGLPALSAIVERLPASLAASVLVVMHTRARTNGLLPQILQRTGALPVEFATDRTAIARARIYVAPPDLHLLVDDGTLRVTHGPRENGFRPAIDPLFRTAAREFGSRVIGVILSGALSDGIYGLSVIKQHGGVAIVQDPGEAIVSSMPINALREVDVDHVLPAAEIADTIVRLSSDRARGEGGTGMARSNELEPQLPQEELAVSEMHNRFGPPSALTCPDCGGALWEIQDGRVLRYQCHVGHQYSPDNLETEQREEIDSALWSAVRVLEEHAELKMRMAKRAAAGGMVAVSEGFAEGARDAHDHARRIRAVLIGASNGGSMTAPPPPTEAPPPPRDRAARGPRRRRQAGSGNKRRR